MNPFLVLGLTLRCTDEEVRAAYHTLLRKHTPEQDAAGFQQIQEAYEMLRTERDRWRWHLLRNLPLESPLEALEGLARLPGRARPPGAAAFQSLLGACATAAWRDLSAK
jgi:curved DNA-binding protein CbpA